MNRRLEDRKDPTIWRRRRLPQHTLMGREFRHPGILPEALNPGSLPGVGPGRILVEEVVPRVQLHLADLRREPE